MSVLLYEVRDGIATITLNRPERRNAFNVEMLDLWLEALRDARTNDAVQVIVVTGAGRAFCSGGDVGSMSERGDMTGLEHKRWLEVVHRIPLTLEEIDKPVIAALNGAAAGAGLDMALMCDLRFAAEGARFSEAYVKVGLIPGDGGTYFLPRLIGTARALELIWSGDVFDAQEAFRLGIVNRVVPPDQLMSTVYEFAGRLAKGPTVAIRLAKRAVYAGMQMDLRAHLDMISSHMAVVRQTEDHKEGVQAFAEKREPEFKGK
jgi:enoyl-CoA hydratase/carnithine racemase